MRKLVSVQTIRAIRPIPNADAIEAATVQGWTVVVGKGEFEVGQKVAYFEIDSFLPGTRPVFETFMARGVKTVPIEGVDVQGHVLKTVKLRGTVSQGLVMSLEKLGYTPGHIDALQVGDDITEANGVVKYEPPLPAGNGNIVGPFDSRFAPKTDAVRLQNLTDYWDLIKTVEWEPTVKVDGTSQTLVNDGGTYRFFGRNWELDIETVHGFKLATELGFLEGLEPGMAIQFERVGPSIQGNRLKLASAQAMVFAVWRDGVKLPRTEWPVAALRHATPILGPEWDLMGELDEMIEKVSKLRGSVSKDVLDEGIVWHPVDPTAVPEELAQVLDRNCNVKLVSNTWLMKSKD